MQVYIRAAGNVHSHSGTSLALGVNTICSRNSTPKKRVDLEIQIGASRKKLNSGGLSGLPMS